MASPAIDVGQSNLNQRTVNAQVLADEDEKVDPADEQSFCKEKPGRAWKPQDAWVSYSPPKVCRARFTLAIEPIRSP